MVGLMPHPERAVHAILGSTDGVPLLQSLLKQAAAVEAAARSRTRRQRLMPAFFSTSGATPLWRHTP